MDSIPTISNYLSLKSWSLSAVTESIDSVLDYTIFADPIFGIVVDGHLLLEVFLVVIIGFLMFQKSYKPNNLPLTDKEIDQVCEEWQPEPLHPSLPPETVDFEEPVLESSSGPRVIIDGKELLNLTSTNSLGLLGNEQVTESARATIEKYGVGSCGPRGFYGTIDVHMDLEESVSSFMQVDDTILYSYGLATPPSTIPAFCKRGDVVLADEGVSWSIQNGIALSRCAVVFFRHNDMADLEEKLKQVVGPPSRASKKVLNRRFIVAEAIYQSSGQVAPLPALLRLRDQYRFRLILDESLSFGTLGTTGQGLTQHHGLKPSSVDIITASMGHSLASEGGFCCGGAHMVDHQRLSGLGYCFSASLPPYLASTALASLAIIQTQPGRRAKLQANIQAFRQVAGNVSGLSLGSSPLSPLQILTLRQSQGMQEDIKALQRLVNRMREEKRVLLSVTWRSPLDRCRLPVGLRVAISAAHEEADIASAAECLRSLANTIL